MRLETRSGLILFGTLVIGVLLGALVSGALAQRRAERVERMRERGGFVGHMERVIQPRDEAQWDAIRPLIEATAERNSEIFKDTRDELRSALEQMKDELAPLLDEEQRERLDAVGRRPGLFGPPPHGRGRGPPPHRPGSRREPPNGPPGDSPNGSGDEPPAGEADGGSGR